MSSVWGFFYGGLINPDVMARVGLKPKRQIVATLEGFALNIAPLVNLVPKSGETVYGLLLEVSHAELQHVYTQLKAVYLPYPVLAHDADNVYRPALCYIVPDMDKGQAEEAHILSLLEPAETLGFPQWYLSKIRSFLPYSGVASPSAVEI